MTSESDGADMGWGFPFLLDNSLPPDRHPKILFMIPTILIGGAIFFGGRAILQRMGKSITKPK